MRANDAMISKQGTIAELDLLALFQASGYGLRTSGRAVRDNMLVETSPP